MAQKVMGKKKKSKSNKVFLWISAFVFLVILIMASPVFAVTEVLLTGNNVLKEDYILEIMGIEKGSNIFFINSQSAKKRLLKDPYAKEIEVVKNYPNKVSINIAERKVRGYVEYSKISSYLLIDEFGRVLDVQKNPPKSLPIILGIKFDDFTKGEILKAENNSEFEIMVTLAQLFTKYEISDIVKVDVTDKFDIKFYIDNVDFKFGPIDDADEKVRNIKAIMKEVPRDKKGIVDVSDIKNRDPFFRYLT